MPLSSYFELNNKIGNFDALCQYSPLTTQLSFTCSKSTMETPEQCVKSVQSYKSITRSLTMLV